MFVFLSFSVNPCVFMFVRIYVCMQAHVLGRVGLRMSHPCETDNTCPTSLYLIALLALRPGFYYSSPQIHVPIIISLGSNNITYHPV